MESLPPRGRTASIAKIFDFDMKPLAVLLALSTFCLLAGCVSSGPPIATYQPGVQKGAVPADTIRVGDKITIRVSGVPDQVPVDEIQVPASGMITMDLLSGSFQAAGRTSAQLASDITAAYVSQKIYTSPVVTVIPEDRYVNVGGDVRSPARIVYTTDSTVMSTINACGGFDEYANRRAVRVIRGSQAFEVDCVKAAQSPGADPAVYPGDQIYVPRTVL